jgi:hypothetical protein
VHLAATAFLGRLWLAVSPRPGLRLNPFTFIKTDPASPETVQNLGVLLKVGLKKTFFSAHQPITFLSIDCCALFGETAGFEYGV